MHMIRLCISRSRTHVRVSAGVWVETGDGSEREREWGPRAISRAIYISIDRWEAEQSARESKAGF